MTYSAVYCALISKRLKNPITKSDCYVEQHHIIPKSEGGLDEPDNLVNLTAREHYIAHLLLAKIYKDFKMFAAVRFMRMKSRKSSGRDFKFNSRLYERMKVEYNKRNKGKKISLESRLKMSLAKIGKHQSPEVIENRRRKIIGRKQSKEEIERRRKSIIGFKHTDEARKNMSKAKKGCVPWNKGKRGIYSEETRRKNS